VSDKAAINFPAASGGVLRARTWNAPRGGESDPELLKQIKKDPVYGKDFKKLGDNPDVGVDPKGNIILKDVRTGNTLNTDWPFENFLP
jgi:hypothetical protein